MKIKIPTSLSDIRLEQFVLFNKLMKESQDENFIQLAMVTVFCDISVEDAKNIIANDFTEIAAEMLRLVKNIEGNPFEHTIAAFEL